jgi:hypothetical protein
MDGVFIEIHVSFNSAEVAYRSNRAYLTLESCDLQVRFLSNSQLVLAGIKVPDAAHSNTDGFLQEIHLFFHVG